MGLKVRLRNGFSDRNNIKKENVAMQLTNFDERTRVELCNFLDLIFNVWVSDLSYSQTQIFLRGILMEVYVREINYSYSYDSTDILNIIKETIRHDEYDDVLTIVEYIMQETESIFHKHNPGKECTLHKYLNHLFEREYVGYRYINNKITPITNDVEIKEIEQATCTRFQKVNSFIDKAIEFLSDRNSPDYRNSIKESISAVEEMCNVILGEAGTLGASLKKLEQSGIEIHPSLKSAFEKLYGYTSDESGIRHAGRIDGKDATFAEAKFMLVSCSAFVNYLIDNMKS